MSDVFGLWLPPEDRLAIFDPLAGLVRVIGWRAGPAGVSAVELGGGLHVVVDHATPTTLTELAVPVDGRTIAADALDLVAQLLGDEATDVIATLPTSTPSDRPIRLGSRYDGSRFTDERHRRFARLALGADLGDDAALSDAARGSALLEAALAAAELHPPSALDLARRGLTRLLSVAVGDPKQGARLEALARTVVGNVERADVWRDVDRVLDELRRRGRPPAAAAAAFAPAAAPAAAGFARPMRHAAEEAVASKASYAADGMQAPGRPVEVDGDVRGWAWLDDGSNVRITAGANASGAWARVFRRHDRLLLGLSPMRGDGPQLDALVVIPPVDGPEAVVVDVVNEPAQPRRAPTHDLLRRAVLTGRRAARLSRLGDPRATSVWHECARQWDVLGDAQRANLARRNGQRDDVGSARGRRGGIEPLLADELDA